MRIVEHLSRKSLNLTATPPHGSESSILSDGTVESGMEIYKQIPEDHGEGGIVNQIAIDDQEGAISTEGNDGVAATGENDQISPKCADVRGQLDKKVETAATAEAKVQIETEAAPPTVSVAGIITKEDLQRYINDPFWVRLRWVCFIAFWLVWLGMLLGAVLFIMGAPKCDRPAPLAWHKRGIFAKYNSPPADNVQREGEMSQLSHSDMMETKAAVRKLHADGVVLQLPAVWTYSVAEPAMERLLLDVIEPLKTFGTRVVLEVSAKYATKSSTLMQQALTDETKRSAFVDWTDDWLRGYPTNESSSEMSTTPESVEHTPAVREQLYELQMNDTSVREAFSGVLKHLLTLGVNGVRLKGGHINNELFEECVDAAQGVSADAFVIRVPEDEDEENENGLVVNGRSQAGSLERLRQQLQNLQRTLSHDQHWDLSAMEVNVEVSSVLLFVSLLPGAILIPINASSPFSNISESLYQRVLMYRETPSYMYGELAVETTHNPNLLAYSRMRIGSPGYLVVFNPSNSTQRGDFSDGGLPNKMTVDALSDNYKGSKTKRKYKVLINELEVLPQATVILTFVPPK